MKPLQTLIALTSLALSMGEARALDIVASTAPVITGSAGVGMTACYKNVATHEGKNLDMFAEILAYSPAGIPCWFLAENGDMRFNFLESLPGMERRATIRWTLYESGTTIPVTIPGFAFTVDDLDDAATHRESLTTSDATSYELNSPTDVTADVTTTPVGPAVTATGGTEGDSGDPRGAVKLHFANRSSVEISYHTVAGTKSVSAYHHDGNGDFHFDNPVETDLGQRLYYTYQFSNSAEPANIILESSTGQSTGAALSETDYIADVALSEADYIASGYREVVFFDSLPGGITWDTSFAPVITGSMQAEVTYSNGGRDASISGLLIPPGGSTMILRTNPTFMTGVMNNDATITPVGEAADPLVAESTINLE